MYGHKKIDRDYSKERKFVSRLIYKVLTSSISVKEALLQYPKDCDDLSIQASWHAISHYEADEELRLKDKIYAQEQYDYLEFIAETLQANKDLPQNIIDNYSHYYRDVPIADNSSMKGILKKLTRFLNV